MAHTREYSHGNGGIMSERYKPCAVALVTVAALIALTGADAAYRTIDRALHPPLRPDSYIRCAMSLDDGPCSLDPSMRRLNGDPPFARPYLPPQPDPPAFAPAR
jgi:hypothetical protein